MRSCVPGLGNASDHAAEYAHGVPARISGARRCTPRHGKLIFRPGRLILNSVRIWPRPVNAFSLMRREVANRAQIMCLGR